MTEPPEAIRPLVRGLHHIAIAVRGIDENRRIFEDLLGLEPGPVELVPEQVVRAMIYDVGGQKVELVEPAAEDAPITRFLTERSGGLHHLAWAVDDVDEAWRVCEEHGVPIIGDAPGPGAHGTRAFFLHPKGTYHILHELVEDPAWEDPA